jgi:hypothetical protein
MAAWTILRGRTNLKSIVTAKSSDQITILQIKEYLAERSTDNDPPPRPNLLEAVDRQKE